MTTDEPVGSQISLKIAQLSNQGLDDRKNTLAQLSELVNGVGISEDDLEYLFQLVCNETEMTISGTEKRFLLQHIMLFNQQTHLDPDLIYKIVSQVGIPQIYFKNGRKTKLKRLPKTVQVLLLEWLICNVHLFGENGYKTLRSMLPILFKALSFEFSRPQIAHIIFLTVLRGSVTFKTYFNKKKVHIVDTVRPWHVDLVEDLHHKFPMDENLKALLVVFESTIKVGPIRPHLFAYPNLEYLKLLDNIKPIRGPELAETLRKYKSFTDTLVKRRKYRSSIDFEEYSLDFSTTSSLINISDIRSTQSLVSNLNNIAKVNYDTLDGYAIHYLTLKGIEENQNHLDYYMRLSLLDDNLSVQELNELCDRLELLLLASAGLVYHPLVIDFVLYKFQALPIVLNPQKSELLIENLKQRLKFVKFLPILDFSEFKKSFIVPTLAVFTALEGSSSRNYYFSCFIHHLLLLFSIWLKSEKLQTTTQKFNKYTVIDRTLPMIYTYIRTFEKSPFLQLLILEIVHFIRSIQINSLNVNFNDEAVILPPDILYRMILDGDPFVSSETFEYIAVCKNYQFKSEKYKGLQNSYIMDLVNLLWRDRAFTYEEALSNKALFLNPKFLARLGNLHIFTYSDLVTFETVFNLFVNPAWSFITAQLIRKFEDLEDDINTRHEGPVSPATIIRMNSDPDVQWLGISYEELKLRILQELDDMGFVGLADLLFNSLKTLKDKRIKGDKEE